MEFADLKNKSEKELRELLAEKRDELRELRFKAAEKQLKNVQAISKGKKTIARILTLLVVKNKIQS
ncbi:MAG: 50S ribosomal protein L29 [Candidatus Magasanikbacteria bacterium]|nr:50S ribosomal protein L29 [Candidatus Magasanikbacteria bacterium]